MTLNTFESLITDKGFLSSLAALNITVPTEVQLKTIPLAMEGKDLIVQAQTGSGKTLAFALPIISKIRNEKSARGTTALIVTPTRELAVQIKSVVESIAPDIKPACIIGGTNFRGQEKQLREDCRIVVGTPGRLLDFLRQRLIVLKKCETFVLDEADEMLSMGFLDDVRDILTKLPAKRQGMFFSATISGRVLSLASGFLRSPKTINVETELKDIPKIEHFYCKVDSGLTSKANAICKIFENSPDDSAIIFCNTKSDTELLEVILKRRGFNAEKINSDLSQRERDRVLSSLRNKELKFLIATDVASRGIDIKELGMVINYSLPKEAEVYTHRTGRTGRAGASGKAISIIAPQDMGLFFNLMRDRRIRFEDGNMNNSELKEITFQAA